MRDFRKVAASCRRGGGRQRQHGPWFTPNTRGIGAACHAAAQFRFQIHARTWINSPAQPGDPTALSLGSSSKRCPGRSSPLERDPSSSLRATGGADLARSWGSGGFERDADPGFGATSDHTAPTSPICSHVSPTGGCTKLSPGSYAANLGVAAAPVVPPQTTDHMKRVSAGLEKPPGLRFGSLCAPAIAIIYLQHQR